MLMTLSGSPIAAVIFQNLTFASLASKLVFALFFLALHRSRKDGTDEYVHHNVLWSIGFVCI